jgi:hypothetical protein
VAHSAAKGIRYLNARIAARGLTNKIINQFLMGLGAIATTDPTTRPVSTAENLTECGHLVVIHGQEFTDGNAKARNV